MKTIDFDLSEAGLDHAIRELNAYTGWFRIKCRELRKRVAERIAWNAQEGFRTARGNDIIIGNWPVNNNVDVVAVHEDTMSVVFAEGEEAVFIEFGAGVYYNGNPGDSPHPWGVEHGYVIGGYGKHKGTRNAWNIAKGVVTRGTPADMPMYRGAEEAIRVLDEIVWEVFH